MNSQIQALKAEVIKNKYSNIIWATFVSFAIAPIMAGVFMLIMRNPDALAKASALNAKMEAMNVNTNWDAYLSILSQAMGIGGILIFGFIASWIFGREYSDKTVKDLLALPTSRTRIVNAKFVIYILWTMGLAISNLLIGFVIGLLLQLSEMDYNLVLGHLSTYFTTTVLTLSLGTPIAFFAICGRGYLAPLGFVALTLVFAQIIAATGYGYYFPWSVPGLYSGAGGEYKFQLNGISYIILWATSLIGYCSTIAYWKCVDQTK